MQNWNNDTTKLEYICIEVDSQMHANTSEGKSKRKNDIRIYSMIWFNWKLSNIWKSTNDTKKYLRQKMYGTEGGTLCFYLFNLAILKRPVKVTLTFFNGYLQFLLHILVADIQTFLIYYKLVSFASSAIEI